MPKAVSNDQYSLIKSQNISMLDAQKEEIKFNKNLLNNNWVTEKWKPFQVELKPQIKKKQKFSSNMADFLKSNITSALEWEKIKINSPVFIHWEFDNWQPWLIPEDDKSWNTSFMVPVGTWRFFFTSNMSATLTSSSHKMYNGLEGPNLVSITFDNM